MNDRVRRTCRPRGRVVRAGQSTFRRNTGPGSIKHTVSFSLLLLVGLLYLKFSWNWIASRFAVPFGVRGIADPAGLPLLAALISVYMFLATPVFNTNYRAAETEADMSGSNAAREPDGIA
jgi:STE24 endopeptidase